MRRAPVRMPSGLKVAARSRKLFDGLPSSSVPTPTMFRLRILVADDDEPFLAVGDVEEAVHRVDGLFLVLRMALAQRIDAERRRRRDRGGELRLHVEPLAERRHRRGDDPLAEVLVVDVADVVDAEAPFAERRVEVLAALLHVEHLLASAGGMVVRVRQLQAALLDASS